MKVVSQVLPVLLREFNYSAAMNVCKNYVEKDSDFLKLLIFAKENSDFDFKRAKTTLKQLKGKMDPKDYDFLEENVNQLIDGQVKPMFTELLWSIIFQAQKEEYIDFVGRLYRFNEAFFKYIFARDIFKDVRFNNTQMSKKRLHNELKSRYKIFNYNIIFAVEEYCKMMHKHERVIEKLKSEKMHALVELRHESVVGHGFSSVSLNDIEKAFGTTDEIIAFLVEVLDDVGIGVEFTKYERLNEFIIQTMKREIHEDY